jgi:glycosyltransferase involved in cell wall biosynthesis
MKVLMISTDVNILEDGNAVRARMVSYGTVCDELHIVVVQKSKVKNEGKDNAVKISENVFVYRTHSRYKINSLREAYRIGVGILTKGYKLKVTDGWLVTSQDPFETGFISWWIARKVKAKLQLQIHTDFLSPYFRKESLLNKVRVALSKFLLPRADGIRVVSERITYSLKANSYKLKTAPIVLPIFVDIENIRKFIPVADLHKKYPQFDFVFLMASRMTKEKNIGIAVEAMREIIKYHPKAGLVIVGSGPGEFSLKLKIKNYKLSDNIAIEPWQNDIISYYKTADTFLLTSEYEGFGMTLIEAAASDCPIISTDVGIVGNVFIKDEDVLVCSVGDTECFVKNMDRFINYPQVRKECVMRAQTALEVFRGREEHLKRMREAWEGCMK